MLHIVAPTSVEAIHEMNTCLQRLNQLVATARREDEQEKNRLEQQRERNVVRLQLEFLLESKNQKKQKLAALQEELALLEESIIEVKHQPGQSKRIKYSECTFASSKCHRILENLTDLENNFFVSNGGISRIGTIIDEAFKFDHFELVGSMSLCGDTALTHIKINDMQTNVGGLLGVVGGTKSVNIYRFSDVEDAPFPYVYPVVKIPTKAFGWSIAWNPSLHNLFATGDFNSNANVIDMCTGVITNCYSEHSASKFIAVEFTPTKPQQLATAAFDGYVKLWRLNEPNSVLTIRAPDKNLNLAYKQDSPCHLVVASINKNLYCYDVRSPTKPMITFTGHNKSVFQLKFLDHKRLVSASVDGSLRLWSVDTGHCTRIFRGHDNTNKFIGQF